MCALPNHTGSLCDISNFQLTDQPPRVVAAGRASYSDHFQEILPGGSPCAVWNQSCVHVTLSKTQVSKYKTVARHNFSHLDRQDILEHRACIHEGVEFPVLAAGIDLWRQIREKLLIEFPANEFRREFWLPSGWGMSGRRFLMRTLVSLRQEPILACFGGGQQFAELRSSPELHKQWVGLQGGVGAIVVLDGTSQQANSGILLPTIRQHGSEVIPRLRINSRKGSRFDLLSRHVKLGCLLGVKTGLNQITTYQRHVRGPLHALSCLAQFALTHKNESCLPCCPIRASIEANEFHCPLWLT